MKNLKYLLVLFLGVSSLASQAGVNMPKNVDGISMYTITDQLEFEDIVKDMMKDAHTSFSQKITENKFGYRFLKYIPDLAYDDLRIYTNVPLKNKTIEELSVNETVTNNKAEEITATTAEESPEDELFTSLKKYEAKAKNIDLEASMNQYKTKDLFFVITEQSDKMIIKYDQAAFNLIKEHANFYIKSGALDNISDDILNEAVRGFLIDQQQKAIKTATQESVEADFMAKRKNKKKELSVKEQAALEDQQRTATESLPTSLLAYDQEDPKLNFKLSEFVTFTEFTDKVMLIEYNIDYLLKKLRPMWEISINNAIKDEVQRSVMMAAVDNGIVNKLVRLYQGYYMNAGKMYNNYYLIIDNPLDNTFTGHDLNLLVKNWNKEFLKLNSGL